jgi:SpoIID/LytB domain protein
MRRLLLVGLVAALVLLCFPRGVLALGDAIPVVARPGTQSGMVQVRLDTLGTAGTYTLVFQGPYSVGGEALAEGSRAVVKAQNGGFSLTANGQTRAMGTSFTVVRQSGGVKIAEAYTPSNVYPGDLTFIMKGGVPYVVCHVFIEDYLLGVVGYEMSDSFPLDALKAQAITARTYAMRRVDSSDGSYYDLRDTTADQVYRGTPAGASNVRAAVSGTAGLVLMYNGGYCAVYYASSNGGQTETAQHAWGGSGYPYYTMQDDPFDLANTASTVRRGTVYATFSRNGASLRSLLTSALQYQCGASSAIETIEALTPVSPRYEAPSRLYTKIRVRVRCASGTAYDVTLDLFGGLDGAIGMVLSGLKNELFTVEAVSGGFSLQARRYGHGVGLSQYGAQQMAKTDRKSVV